MGLLKKLVIAFSVVMAGIVAIGFNLPDDYEVKRSIVIEAAPEEIYPEVVNLKAWSSWGVWFQRDPNMQIEYGGPDRAIGMYTRWESDSQGHGEMEITELAHNRKVVYALRFPDYEMDSSGKIVLEQIPDGTRVTWLDSGEVGDNPVNRYIALMIDEMIGPDFETGLENLKTVVENKS